MKGFLFDENHPRKIRFLSSLPIVHVESLGANRADAQIWEYARAESLVIVSKEADFSDRILAAQPPPWVVHLRIGNLRRAEFHQLLAKAWPRIEALLPAHKAINVYRDRIEAVR